MKRAVLAIALAAAAVAALTAQAVSVTAVNGLLRLRAPAFDVIQGAVLDALRDGKSLELNLGVTVLARAGGPALAERRQVFKLSFDLWEERVAVTRVGTPPRSVSHLRPKDAEAWCFDNLLMPVADMHVGPETPFWIKLDYDARDQSASTDADAAAAFSLRTLIDALSRRRQAGQLAKSLEAGPFRLPR